MFYRTDEPVPLPRNPFAAIVSPRPIAWITTRGTDGCVNLAPYSFFTAVAYEPPQVIVSSVGTKPDRETGKDTLSNAQGTGVLCINIAGAADVEALNTSSGEYGREVDEAALTGLALEECNTISCPRLRDVPASLECRLTQTLPLAGTSNILMIAEVLAVHLRDDCINDEGRFDVTRYRPLTRLGYLDYATIDDVFALRRPKVGAGGA